MGHAYLLLFMCTTISYATEFLQNPDFEIPPTNLTSNSSNSRTLLLPGANSIPGWSFKGTVWYLTSGAVQLGRNGQINQTIRAVDEAFDYYMSFTLAAQTQACMDSHVSVNVSVYKGSDVENMRQFSLQRNYSRNLWGRRALFVGQLVQGQTLDIHIQSEEEDNNTAECWPVVDDFAVTGNSLVVGLNGDFEDGLALLNNSSEGIILNKEVDIYSPLQGWSILGTVKYYKAPNGNAAIELLSGAPSGVRREFLDPPETSTLSFTMGDANDSCIGDFIVYIEAGADKFNFSMRSLGTGSAINHSVKVTKLSSMLNVLTFYSLNETLTSDGVLCGPVLDNIHLISYGERKQYHHDLLFFSLFIVLLLLC